MKNIIKKAFVILILLIIILIIGIFIFIKISFKNGIPVLAYHDVLKNPVNDTDISIDKFEKQMKYLHDNDYKALSMDEFYDWKTNKKKINGKKVLITFDDGRRNFLENAIPIMEKYNIKATIFVIGDRIGSQDYLTIEDIEEIKRKHKNMNVQSHSFGLHRQDLARSNDYKIYNEDMKMNSINNYKYYAYPFGINNNNYKKALKDNKYKLAFLFSNGKWATKDMDNYYIRRVPVYNSTSYLKFIMKVTFNISRD